MIYPLKKPAKQKDAEHLAPNDILKQIRTKEKLVSGLLDEINVGGEISMERITYDLPSKWSWVPLGEVATLLNGRAYKQAELLDSGPTPVLRVGNFFL